MRVLVKNGQQRMWVSDPEKIKLYRMLSAISKNVGRVRILKEVA